jgi:uncharacterized protein YndB with AHSA1/START domain
MPVKRDNTGQRYVEAEIEVPGSPEDVWRAIATGNGISAWFVPSTVEERVGGTAVSSFGPGMDSVATIRTWNPPRSFIAETDEGGPGKVATEFMVEARAGGTCVVRVVHRWFASTDDWDAQFEGHAYGWASFFRILRIYLTHFAGQKCSAFQLAAFSKAPAQETWQAVSSALTIDEKARRAASTPGTPVLSGAVEKMVIDDRELLLRLDRPAPGVAHVFAMPMGDQTMVSIRFYLYGDQGAAAAAHAQREWSAWLAKRFPQEVMQ